MSTFCLHRTQVVTLYGNNLEEFVCSMVRNVIKKFLPSASRLYGESTSGRSVAFHLKAQKPHVEAALMI